MAEHSLQKQNLKKQTWIRRVIQISFFLIIFFLVLTHYLEKQGIVLPVKAPSIHAICPFGAVETIGCLVTHGRFVPQTHESNFWVLFASIGATVIIGAVFCGWICPLGSVQDWFGKIGKKIFKKRYNTFIPHKADYLFGFLRYIVLALVIIQTTRAINLVFAKIDPYYALFHFWTGEALPSAIIVLAVVLVGSLFTARPWCRWLCPFGAVQGILQLISPWKIRRNNDICTNCKKCAKVCPMRIKVDEQKSVIDTRCNRCGECLEVCSVKGALDHSLPAKLKLNSSIKNRWLTAAIILILFAAPITFAHVTGNFRTTKTIREKREEFRAVKTIDYTAPGKPDKNYTIQQ